MATGRRAGCCLPVCNSDSKFPFLILINKQEMKHFIYPAGLVLMLLGGCKKDLDIPDPNNLTTETFWKTASDAQQGVNAAYSTFHRVGLARWLFFITIIRADEGFSTSPNSNLVNVYDAFNITDFND